MSVIPTAGWFEGREHRLPVRVYFMARTPTSPAWSNTPTTRALFRERGRSDFLRLAGVHHNELAARDDPSAFVVTRLAMDFVKAARIDDALLVRTTYDVDPGTPPVHQPDAHPRRRPSSHRAEVEAACITLDGRPRKPSRDLVEKLRDHF